MSYKLTAVSIGMVVAFMMYVKELRRNGGETAIYRRRFFCHFSLNQTFLNHLRPSYFFSKKNYPNIFAFDTSNISNILYDSTKKITSVQCKCQGNFLRKKISWAQIIQKFIIQREMAVAAVSPPCLRSSLIKILKATAIPKLTAVTHFLAALLRQF